MIPMPITPEEYAYHFRPAPDYLIVQRLKLNNDRISRIHLPDDVKNSMTHFVGVGKVLAVSDLRSEDDYIEQQKQILREIKYVGFEFHVVAECIILPQFELPRDVSLVCMHVKDAVYFPRDLDTLLKRQREYEAKREKEIAEQANAK